MALLQDVRSLGRDLERSYPVYVRDRLMFCVGSIVCVAFSLDERVLRPPAAPIVAARATRQPAAGSNQRRPGKRAYPRSWVATVAPWLIATAAR